MTLLYYDPIFLEHDTGDHPESADQIIPVVRHLNFVALDTLCKRPAWKSITLERLARVHSPDYVEAVKSLAAKGAGYIEPDTAVRRCVRRDRSFGSARFRRSIPQIATTRSHPILSFGVPSQYEDSARAEVIISAHGDHRCRASFCEGKVSHSIELGIRSTCSRSQTRNTSLGFKGVGCQQHSAQVLKPLATGAHRVQRNYGQNSCRASNLAEMKCM